MDMRFLGYSLCPENCCLTPLFLACNTLFSLFMDEILIFFQNRFEEQEAPGSRSFFTEIIASISDVKFARDGRYLLSRDYMSLKVLNFLYFCTASQNIYTTFYLLICSLQIILGYYGEWFMHHMFLIACIPKAIIYSVDILVTWWDLLNVNK